MRRRKGIIPQALLSLFHELFFVNPFSDKEMPSLVYEGPDGKVVGFLGPECPPHVVLWSDDPRGFWREPRRAS